MKLSKYVLALALMLGVSSAQVVKIGVNLPITGPNAPYGQMGWLGLKLANQERPKVLGKKVELVLVDNKSDKIEAANATQRLIKKDGVFAIIGPISSSNTLSAAPIAENAHVPLISPWATNPIVTQNRRYIFRACFIDPFQGKVAAKFAIDKLHAKTAAVMIDIAQDYCVGIANFFIQNFTKMGGKIVSTTYYQTGDQDFTAQLSSIKAVNPDLIYVPGYFTEDALIMRQARDLGLKQTFMSGDAAQAEELIKIGGKAVDGLYFTTHFDENGVTTEVGKKFVKEFHKKYKKSPDSVSALSYDAYNILLDAIERAGTFDREKVRDEIENTKNFEGVTGVITIEHGDGIKPAVILKVENGKFVYVETVQPE